MEFFVPLLFNGTIHKAVAEAKMKLSRSIVAAVVVFVFWWAPILILQLLEVYRVFDSRSFENALLLSFRPRRACHLTQTNNSGKSLEHQVFHVCTRCMAIFGVTSQGTKYRERLATNVKPERLRYATILTQDTWSLSLTTNISKFVYALHAYFLIGLRCPSGNNKRAMGVTDDSEVQSTMEQERTSSIAPSSFAPSPLWEKKNPGLLSLHFSHVWNSQDGLLYFNVLPGWKIFTT